VAGSKSLYGSLTSVLQFTKSTSKALSGTVPRKLVFPSSPPLSYIEAPPAKIFREVYSSSTI